MSDLIKECSTCLYFRKEDVIGCMFPKKCVDNASWEPLNGDMRNLMENVVDYIRESGRITQEHAYKFAKKVTEHNPSLLPYQTLADRFMDKVTELHDKEIKEHIDDYNPIAASYTLNSNELATFNKIKSEHCCGIRIVFGEHIGLGRPVFAWIPCKSEFRDISDYDSW